MGASPAPIEQTNTPSARHVLVVVVAVDLGRVKCAVVVDEINDLVVGC